MPQSTAELFARIDAGHGGPLQTFKRRVKFGLRHAWFRQQIQAQEQSFDDRGLGALLQEDGHLLVKAVRPYLWTGLNGGQRFEFQRLHFQWMVERFSPDCVQRFYAAPWVELASLSLDGHLMAVCLRPARGPSREGELEAVLTLDGQVFKRSVITVLPAAAVGLQGGAVMVLGSMQGFKESKDLMKQATQLLERTPPRSILLNALQGMARAWGLSAMVGVSDAGHVYAGYRSLSSRVGLSYDELWKEQGASQRAGTGLWVLPLEWQPRPEHEVESKKRSQLRRRNALRQQVVDACAQGAQSLGLA